MGGKLFGTKDASPLERDEEMRGESRRALILTFVLPAVIVAVLLFVLVSFRGSIETAVADFTQILPVGYAFAAGMVASVNPCGVLLLPSYVLYQLKSREGSPSTAQRALHGIVIAAVVTAGFVLVFGAVGVVIAAGGQWLVRAFPFVGLVVGIAMAGLGIWILLADKTLGILVASGLKIERQRTLANAFLFGLTYAIGSLSCTLPIFLAVVGTSLTGGGPLGALSQFIGYAVGMGAVILFVTLGAVLFRRAMGRWLRLITPYVHRVTALFAIGAGLYLAYYWIFVAGLS
jgi:cytochrome c biogenesis protein CcdA